MHTPLSEKSGYGVISVTVPSWISSYKCPQKYKSEQNIKTIFTLNKAATRVLFVYFFSSPIFIE